MLFIKVSRRLESLAPCTQIFSKRHQIHQLEIFGDLGDFRKTSSDGSDSKSLRSKFWQKEVKWGQRTCIFPKSTNHYRVNQPMNVEKLTKKVRLSNTTKKPSPKMWLISSKEYLHSIVYFGTWVPKDLEISRNLGKKSSVFNSIFLPHMYLGYLSQNGPPEIFLKWVLNNLSNPQRDPIGCSIAYQKSFKMFRPFRP